MAFPVSQLQDTRLPVILANLIILIAKSTRIAELAEQSSLVTLNALKDRVSRAPSIRNQEAPMRITRLEHYLRLSIRPKPG